VVEGVSCQEDPASDERIPEGDLVVVKYRAARYLKQGKLVVPVPDAPVPEVNDYPPEENKVEQYNNDGDCKN